ncbi:FAD-binding molybdopterin dehydrogenase (plasmid) [Diaphorobacter sp. HDW4B]|uniref:FAD binding domain-containing protein n=1 Tax=Diaphorobacter sp. HDW4B TaxID=2714925 RepID=UPI00140B553C|nr:FAD binding domain-containing protein [Diaphorobacter sp. HDW4B]QIL74233.1 FAD-binding molybdopterin dehydrogenase [Diaphorobacter sp. HDW4B]
MIAVAETGLASSTFYQAHSVQDALEALDKRGPNARVLAGGTWLMRAGLRGDGGQRDYVSLAGIAELKQVQMDEHQIRIGSGVTHAELARALSNCIECHALASAAGASANPAVRNVATLGGNLCATDFSAADLIPALLALNAQVRVVSLAGGELLGIEQFLAERGQSNGSHIVESVLLQIGDLRHTRVRSAHVRLPLRKAGDYPVAIMSAAVATAPDGTVTMARVAVGFRGSSRASLARARALAGRASTGPRQGRAGGAGNGLSMGGA